MNTNMKKPIKVRLGGITKLAKSTGYSIVTVRKALRWNADTDAENLIRKRAVELGLVKRF